MTTTLAPIEPAALISRTEEELVAMVATVREVGLARLAAAQSAAEMIELHAQTVAMEAYIASAMKTRELKKQAMDEIGELRQREEREIGKWLDRTKALRSNGGRPPKTPSKDHGVSKPQLSDLGITQDQSTAWQADAKGITDSEFDEIVSELKSNPRADVTATAIRRKAKERKKQAKAEEQKCQPETVADLPPSADLRLGDFRRSLADIADGSVDAIVTDPPYGRDALPLYADLSVFAARTLKPGGSCLVMVGQSYLPDALTALASALSYQWTLAYLTPGGQSPQIWPRKVNTFWKPVIWLVKGAYSGDWIGDVIKTPVNDNDKRFHEWGQGEYGIQKLLEIASRPGDLVCDPFLGGGTTGVIALATGRRFVGCDADESAMNTARARMMAL